MSWEHLRLEDCTRIVSGATPSTSVSDYWDGDINWATPKDLSDLATPFIQSTPRRITAAGLSSCAAEVLPAYSVLLSSRAPIGHVAINAVPMATNQGFKSFIPDRKKLDTSYLYWWLRTNKAYLQSLGNGATFKEISKAIVERIEIPVPPLDEQRWIAAILNQADALAAKRREVLESVNGLPSALFEETFQSDGIFPTAKLSTLCRKITDGTHQAPKWSENGIPFIFSSNVRNGKISLNTEKHISPDVYRELMRTTPVERGDVLYTAVGSYGNAAVVDTNEEFAFQRHIAHIKPDHTKINSRFLAVMLEAPIVRRQADRVANGLAQKTVTLADIKRFEVISPPREIQDGFEALLLCIERQRQRLSTQLDRMEALFASILDRAFRGELRHTDDGGMHRTAAE
jgi:type I restriction enzyme S subunit